MKEVFDLECTVRPDTTCRSQLPEAQKHLDRAIAHLLPLGPLGALPTREPYLGLVKRTLGVTRAIGKLEKYARRHRWLPDE